MGQQIKVYTFFAILVMALWPQASFALEANDIFRNIIESSSGLPGLITGLAYALGLLLGVTGVLKLKEHVDNPAQAPMRVGWIRLLVAGALFALPTVYEAMETAINATGVAGEFERDKALMNRISGLFGSIGRLGVSMDFNNILSNIIDALEDLPGLISAAAYLAGLYFGVIGILKLKEHVEDPNKAELREGVTRLLIGGAFFSIPTIFAAMYNAVSGDGLGFGGNVASIFSGLNMAYSSESGTVECLSIPIISSWFGSKTLGSAMCNVITATASLPSFLTSMAYIIGMIMGFWGLLKLREAILQPQQVQMWEGISRLLVGGAMFALPVVVEAARSTFVPGNLQTIGGTATNTGFNDGSGAGGGGLLGGLWDRVTGVFDGFMGAIGFGGGCAPSGSGLDSALTCFMQDIYGPMHVLLNFFGFAAGMILIMVGISRLMKSTQEGAKGPIGMGTVMTFVTGGALLSFNGLIRGISASFFGSPVTKTYATLEYTKGMDGGLIESSYAVINSVVQFMILIGLISFIRGLFILRSAAEGGQQASIMAGVTHIIGGALAVNLGPVVNAVQATLGYGVIQFS